MEEPGSDGAGEAALREVVAGVREWLSYEASLGTQGLPPTTYAPSASRAVPAAPATSKATPRPTPPISPPESATVVRAEQALSASSLSTGRADGPEGLDGSDGREERLRVLEAQAARCTACELHRERKQSVFARGNPHAEIVFVGEGPGRDEDEQGEPFVGRAGQLLNKMIAAMGFGQDQVYICNVVKCRPPENRTPRPEEALACRPLLTGQLQAVSPRVIVALGKCAAEHLGVMPERGPWRGHWAEVQGTPVLSTYHPAFLLRSPEFKRVVWNDLQEVMARLGRQPAPRIS